MRCVGTAALSPRERPVRLPTRPKARRKRAFARRNGASGLVVPETTSSLSRHAHACAPGRRHMERRHAQAFCSYRCRGSPSSLPPARSQPPLAQEQSLTVFAAASMKNALDDINAAFTKKTSIKMVASYAATSALMRQIEQGAPADIFASADLEWMDYGAQEQADQPEHAREPAGQPAGADRAEGFQDRDGEARAGLRPRQARRRRPHRHRRREVGAGRPLRHGRAAEARRCGRRSKSGWPWSRTCAWRSRWSPAARRALGIVYETDAKVEPGVKIVGALPGRLASRDRLSGRRDRESQAPKRRATSTSCSRGASKSIFEKYGFSFLVKPTS